ncbi:MAG: hypothetical protein ACLVI9_07040 [Anaerostipes hadrus]
MIHTYARLTQLQTGQTQTETDKIPKIKKMENISSKCGQKMKWKQI